MNTHNAALIVEHLDRIATALERQADADPLTMLADMTEQDVAMNDAGPLGDREPKKPFASNGATLLYALPDADWYIVARRDKAAESGYSVAIERA